MKSPSGADSAPFIKAITTRYRGYNFRSRLEARWAVFFDEMGIRWDYEPQGFDMGEYGPYLPDFWLPRYDAWVEVKGSAKQLPEDFCAVEELAVLTHTAGLLLIGLPKFDYYQSTVWCRYADNDRLHGFMSLDDQHDEGHFNFREFDSVICQSDHCHNAWWKLAKNYSKRYQGAVAAARSARFEHGESGKS